MATKTAEKWTVLADWTPGLKTERRYADAASAIEAAEGVARQPWNRRSNGALVRPPKGRGWYVRG